MILPGPKHLRSPLALSLLLALGACGGGEGATDPPGNGGGNGGTDPVGIVSGTVVESGGGGVANVTLRLTRSGASPLSTTTNASGAFTFESVPVATWTLSITVPDAYELASGTASRSVNVTDGGTVQENFSLERFEGQTINVVDNAFQPAEATVDRGTEVRWRATTSTFHTVTPDGHSEFSRTETNAIGTVLRATFNTPGTYEYFCEPHQSLGMTGAVVVN